MKNVTVFASIFAVAIFAFIAKDARADRQFQSTVSAIDGSGIQAIDGSGIHAIDGSGLQAIDGSGLRAIDGSGLRAIDGSGIQGSENQLINGACFSPLASLCKLLNFLSWR